MPPNVKENAAVAESLATLDVKSYVDPKKTAFLPLTHPQEQQQQQAVKKQEDDDAYITASHYWDWPTVIKTQEEHKQATIDAILREEAIRQTLSVVHIQENLEKQAHLKQDDDNVKYITSITSKDVSNSYWDMSTNVDEKPSATVVVSKHVHDVTHPKTTYWDWPSTNDANKKAALTAQIVKEEELRQKMSVQHMEENLMKQAQQLQDKSSSAADNLVAEHDSYWEWNQDVVQQAEHVNDESHPHASYWDWPSLTKEEQKQGVIDDISKEEEIRQRLSVTHLEETLVKNQRTDDAALTCLSAGGGDNSSDEYWNR